MFLAHDSYQVPVFSPLASAGKSFRVINLAAQLPWHVLTFEIEDTSCTLLHTVCCSWDSDLLQLLRANDRMTLLSLQHMLPCRSRAGGWVAHDIEKVWANADANEAERVILLKSWTGDQFLSNGCSVARANLSDLREVAHLSREMPTRWFTRS